MPSRIANKDFYQYTVVDGGNEYKSIVPRTPSAYMKMKYGGLAPPKKWTKSAYKKPGKGKYRPKRKNYTPKRRFPLRESFRYGARYKSPHVLKVPGRR